MVNNRTITLTIRKAKMIELFVGDISISQVSDPFVMSPVFRNCSWVQDPEGAREKAMRDWRQQKARIKEAHQARRVQSTADMNFGAPLPPPTAEYPSLPDHAAREARGE